MNVKGLSTGPFLMEGLETEDGHEQRTTSHQNQGTDHKRRY